MANKMPDYDVHRARQSKDGGHIQARQSRHATSIHGFKDWSVLLATAAVALAPALPATVSSQTVAPSAPQIAAHGMMRHGTPACSSCHGLTGEGLQSQKAPRLAGLNSDYTVRQLHAFQAGGRAGRDSQRMAWAARSLTDHQIQALADYYATLAPKAAPGPPIREDLSLGRRLATQGNWTEKVPPCGSCHGADGLGVNDLSPPIAGQRADYIERELWRFRRNERRDDPLALMRGISTRLTVPEIKAVAAYYATLPPTSVPTTKPAITPSALRKSASTNPAPGAARP
jgi:cytochrome c553